MHRRKFVQCATAAVAGVLLRPSGILTAAAEVSPKKITDFLSGRVPGKFAANLSPGLGLSFSHSGLSNIETMTSLGSWMEEAGQSEDGHQIKRIKLENGEQGLRVVLEYTLFPEHNAVFYGGTIENIGTRAVDRVTNPLSYDILFKPLQKLGDPLLHLSKGGGNFNNYPPDAYTLSDEQLFGPESFSLDSDWSGRATNSQMPYFIIEDGDGASGIYGGIEWSSLWHLNFIRKDEPPQDHYGVWGPDKSFAIQGGMKGVTLRLEPQEVFHIPRVLLGFYEGGFEQGRFALRNFMADWAPPLPQGVPDPHVQATPGGVYTSRSTTNTETVRRHAKACADLGVEYYCIEQWYPWYPFASKDPQTSKLTGWSRGSWVPDTERFPDLAGLADYVRSLGMKFGLWTDIEVARAGSIVEREHPDWVLFLPDAKDRGLPDSVPDWVDTDEGLLNFGLPEVQQWAISVYDRLIADYGLKWIFWDNNINPAPIWEANEPVHRRGWLQHNHIRGVWAVREALLKKHPDVLIENCSSGGRRNDLGMFKRAHFHVLSDQFWYPDAIRYQFSGADYYFPADRIKSIVDSPLSPNDDNLFHANFGGLLSITTDLESYSPEEWKKTKRHVEVYKSVRHFLKGDFYPLFPQPQTMKEWDGWQFHDSKSGEGFILAFRVTSPQGEARLKFKSLDPARQYSLKDPYTGKEEVAGGRALMEAGLPLKLDLRGTALRVYSHR
jgi:alpha-galactosidase